MHPPSTHAPVLCFLCSHLPGCPRCSSPLLMATSKVLLGTQSLVGRRQEETAVGRCWEPEQAACRGRRQDPSCPAAPSTPPAARLPPSTESPLQAGRRNSPMFDGRLQRQRAPPSTAPAPARQLSWGKSPCSLSGQGPLPCQSPYSDFYCHRFPHKCHWTQGKIFNKPRGGELISSRGSF